MITKDELMLHGELDGYVSPDCGCKYCEYGRNQITLRKWKEYEHWLGEWNGDEPAPQEHMTFEDWLQEA